MFILIKLPFGKKHTFYTYQQDSNFYDDERTKIIDRFYVITFSVVML